MNSHSPSKKNLLVIWLVLVLLHFAILGSAYLNLKAAGTPIIVILAVVQMVLILLCFMEVRYRSRLIWMISCAGFLWLLFQWTLTMSDYLTRLWH